MLTTTVMWYLKILVLLFGATQTSAEGDNMSSSGEHYLFNDLFRTYNRHIRPVTRSNEITYVFFEIALLNLIKLDTRNQVLMTNSEMIMKWYDHHLKWDPEEYENTTTIRVPYNDIWYPDVILYNTGDTSYRNAIYNTNAIIKYTGEVELVSHAMLTSTCDIEILYYPFDEQNCKQHFASWTYDSSKIKLVQGPAEISEYEQHPEYFLEDYYSEISEQHDPCCELPFSTLTIHVRVQRRSLFAVYFYIVPGTIVNLCGLMVFILPAEAGEKVSLATNALLAMMVFLMAMTQDIPPTEHVPLIGKYYGVCIGLLAFNIGVSVVVLRVHFSDADTVPPFVRWVRQ
ncbi:neuronal acetylcholine receptor subunit alpha-9-like [Oratosquilla oratoria]|uniref:neuronal acetylcholine receptor subunit alpha-9-like n=1 Tax=Oratosquilla oratoria TaxID=337810 RepID=UPI003F770F66